jgi:allophanate hydrolase subunit 2
MCQRYYEAGNAKWYVPNSGATSMFATVSYKVNKRTYPVVAFNSTGIVGGYHAMTTVETNYTDSFAGQTPGDELNFGWTSSAEL